MSNKNTWPDEVRLKMTDETNLLPCPFCGGSAEIKQFAKNGLHVRCKRCLAGLKQRVRLYSLEWLREKLIEHWNTRV